MHKNLPTDFTNLVLWLEGGTLLTNSSGLVTNWTDRSGGHRDFVQTTAGSIPLFNANSIRGLPGVTFQRALENDSLRNTGANQLTTSLMGSNTTYYFVVVPLDAKPICLFDSGAGYPNVLRNPNDGTWDLQNGPFVNPTSFSAGMAHIITVTTAVPGANRILSVWNDGTIAGSSTGAVAPLEYHQAALGNMNNGGGVGGGIYGGDIDEVIIYNRVLTSNEFQRVGAYLTTKLGLTTTFQVPIGNGTLIQFR